MNDLTDVELQALLAAEDISPSLIEPYPLTLTHGYLAALAEGQVDVVPGYAIGTPQEAQQIGVEIVRFRPASFGIHFYGDSLFTHQRVLERDPALVERFVEASLRGWKYALTHPEEIAKRIIREFQPAFPIADYTYDWESWPSPTDQLLWVNPAVERQTGYSVGECLAMADYPLPMILPNDRAAMAHHLQKAACGDSANDIEFRILAKNGQQAWVRVQLSLAEALPALYADTVQIQQVVLNLLSNSCEALQHISLAERRLTLATALSGDTVEITESDTGPGLSAEAKTQLCQPFFTTKTSGMGLGLSLSRSIVEAHGGRLWATPNPIRGVTFHCTLPVRKADVMPATGTDAH